MFCFFCLVVLFGHNFFLKKKEKKEKRGKIPGEVEVLVCTLLMCNMALASLVRLWTRQT
jgi:hypothetical protein